MVNIIIYLNNSEDAEKLALDLLKLKLVAHASIDVDNNSYVFDGEIKKEKNFVVTVQTKGLLFTAIEEHVNENYPYKVKIFSMPITQSNAAFFDYMVEHSVKI